MNSLVTKATKTVILSGLQPGSYIITYVRIVVLFIKKVKMGKNFGVSPLLELKVAGVKIRDYSLAAGYPWDDFNIVYVEGINTDLRTTNDDRLDYWNDVRVVLNYEGEILLAAEATSEPGRYYTNNPLNPDGAARIAMGFHKNCWAIGDHKGQDALVQVGDIKIYRDLNQDGSRTGDKVFVGSDFGLNQHTTSNNPELVGRWSAGCLVGRYSSTHATFMSLCRKSGNKKFSTIVIDGSKLWS